MSGPPIQTIALYDIKTEGTEQLYTELGLVAGRADKLDITKLGGNSNGRAPNVVYVCGDPTTILKVGSMILEEIREFVLELGGKFRIEFSKDVVNVGDVAPRLIKELKYNGFENISLMENGGITAENSKFEVVDFADYGFLNCFNHS